MPETTNPMTLPIVLLTLAEHKDGIWITRLQDELESAGELVQVVTLESILNHGFISAKLIVNRVSDAADPHFYKACMGFLLSSFPTKIWNGPISYALCGNKWCHHELLERALLRSPQSIRIFPVSKDGVQQACRQLQQQGHEFPFLLKPNAGGFGAGIVKINNAEEISQLSLPTYADPVALVQAYIPPAQHQLYRIWFLKGKVQCGLIRTNPPGVDEFTTGCAASGVCALSDARKPQPILTAMQSPPKEVVAEIQDRLLPLLLDAHCGSVEYLYDSRGIRFYFDVNLLSTLPLIESVEFATEVWGKDYNPWKELAAAVVDHCKD
jgi:hypothetical protein